MKTSESCLDCQFCYELDEGIEACCSIMDDDKDKSLMKEIDCEYGYCQGKPDWCPLKPLPEKKITTAPVSNYEVQKNLFAEGWNACIDEITGDKVDGEINKKNKKKAKR